MKEIALTGKYGNGKFTIVDDDIYELIKDKKLFMSKEGYVGFSSKDEKGNWKVVYLHRFITNCPKGKLVDHINHNTLDNRRENLRICDARENVRNSRKKSGKVSSKYKGVTKRNNSYHVSIKTDSGILHLGAFTNEISAANFYNFYAKKYHGEFACLNEVDEMSYEECLKYKINKGNSSKYRGVHWDEERNAWICQVYLSSEKRPRKIGQFSNEIAAANAYNYYLKEFNEDLSKLNKVQFMEKSEWEKFIIKKKKTSKYRGVYFNKTDNVWIARISMNKKTIYLGRFKSEKEAAECYNKFIIENNLDKPLNVIDP